MGMAFLSLGSFTKKFCQYTEILQVSSIPSLVLKNVSDFIYLSFKVSSIPFLVLKNVSDFIYLSFIWISSGEYEFPCSSRAALVPNHLL